MESNYRKRFSFLSFIKTMFWLLLVIQLAPFVVINSGKMIQEIMNPQPKIGLLTVHGMISDSTFFLKRLEKFAKNDDIKGLLIKIDSGGGYPGSAQAMLCEIKRFSEKKPVVVFVENMCGSAAYLLACGAHKIVATHGSMIGSIGSIMQIPDAKGFMIDWKIDMHHIAAGKYKTAGSPYRSLTDEEQIYLQSVCHESYQQFIEDVAHNRHLDLATSHVWAEGKVMMGPKALKLGLVDILGSYNDALIEIKRLAEIEGEVKVIKAHRPSGIISLLAGHEDFDADIPSFSQQLGIFLSNVWQSFSCHQMTNQVRII